MADLRPLYFGCPVRFQDRWSGRLTGMDLDETWEVLNVSVQRGLLRKSTVKLPLNAATGWSADFLAFDGTASDAAFSGDLPPVAALARPVSEGTPVAMPGARLAGALIERISRRATDLLLMRGRRCYRVQTAEAGFMGKELHPGVQAQNLVPYLAHDELLERANRAIASIRDLTYDSRRALEVEAADGAVRLRGNVRTKQVKDSLHVALTSAVAGALLVDETVDDARLELDIGAALDRAGLTHTAEVYARSTLGRVTLYGSASSEAVAAEAARVVARVPGVRRVENRIEVRGAPAPMRGAAATSGAA